MRTHCAAELLAPKGWWAQPRFMQFSEGALHRNQSQGREMAKLSPPAMPLGQPLHLGSDVMMTRLSLKVSLVVNFEQTPGPVLSLLCSLRSP